MALVKLSAFRPHVVPHVLGCPDPMVDQALLDAAIEFCERSLIHRDMVDEFQTEDGVADYPLDTAPQLSVAKMLRVWLDGTEIPPQADDFVPSPFAYQSTVEGQEVVKSRPLMFLEAGVNRIAFAPVPDGTYTVTMRAALRPKRDATELDELLYENWVEAIAAGALKRLFAMPGQPWANPALSVLHGTTFRQLIARAQIEASRGRNRAELRVQPVHV